MSNEFKGILSEIAEGPNSDIENANEAAVKAFMSSDMPSMRKAIQRIHEISLHERQRATQFEEEIVMLKRNIEVLTQTMSTMSTKHTQEYNELRNDLLNKLSSKENHVKHLQGKVEKFGNEIESLINENRKICRDLLEARQTIAIWVTKQVQATGVSSQDGVKAHWVPITIYTGGDEA